MARLSLIAFLAFTFSGVSFAAPRDLGTLEARNNQKFVNCGDPSAILSLDVTPYPAEPGEDLDVAVSAYARNTIVENTYATVDVFYGPQHLLTKQVDVCQGNCPIDPGPYGFDYSILLPEEISPDRLNILTQGFSPDDEPLFCFQFSPSV